MNYNAVIMIAAYFILFPFSLAPCPLPSANKEAPAQLLEPGLGFNTAATYSPTFAVPLALTGLTSLFGMGRGGTPSLLPPKSL